MWDWSSFVSGLIGAALGGGVTVFIAFLQRRDTRKERRAAAVAAINEETTALLRAIAHNPPKDGGWNVDVGDQLMKSLAAVSALTALLTQKEAVVTSWVIGAYGIMFEKNLVERMTLGAQVGTNLAQFLAGQRPLSWFKEESGKQDVALED